MIHELPATAFTPRTRTPWLHGDDSQSKRHELLTYFQQTYDLYDSLFEALAVEEAWFNKAIPLRHPLIFYFGHTATFFINKLLLAGLIERRINPAFESMFAIGVNEMSRDDLKDVRMTGQPSRPCATSADRSAPPSCGSSSARR